MRSIAKSDHYLLVASHCYNACPEQQISTVFLVIAVAAMQKLRKS